MKKVRTCIFLNRYNYQLFYILVKYNYTCRIVGFINLDCGLSPKESPYEDSMLELTYTSDDGYVRGGKTAQIEKDHMLALFESSSKLRYFPDGIRNCYNLKSHGA